MKAFKSSLIFLVLLQLPCVALACSPPSSDVSFYGHLQASKNVIVFRLVSTRIIRNEQQGVVFEHVEGTIEILKVLRGSAQFRRIEFSSSMCGGQALSTGHYYIAATTQTGNVIKLGSYDRSIIDLESGASYAKDVLANSPHVHEVQKFLAGKPHHSKLIDYLDGNTQIYPLRAPDAR